MRRDANQRHGGSRFLADARRQRIEPPLVDRGVLRERPLPAEQTLVRAPHPVARSETLHRGTDLFDRPGQVAADDERKRERHGNRAGANVGVDRIDRHGPHAHQHLVGGRLGRGQIAIDDVLGGPSLANVSGFHGRPHVCARAVNVMEEKDFFP